MNGIVRILPIYDDFVQILDGKIGRKNIQVTLDVDLFGPIRTTSSPMNYLTNHDYT